MLHFMLSFLMAKQAHLYQKVKKSHSATTYLFVCLFAAKHQPHMMHVSHIRGRDQYRQLLLMPTAFRQTAMGVSLLQLPLCRFCQQQPLPQSLLSASSYRPLVTSITLVL
jgi:hypothetical protein